MPGALFGRLLELLVERAEEGEPDRGTDETDEILHAFTKGAGVVPGFTSGMPLAHCGQSWGEYVGIETSQSAMTGRPPKVA